MFDSMMASIWLNNMCIANSNGFYMDWILEAKKEDANNKKFNI